MTRLRSMKNVVIGTQLSDAFSYLIGQPSMVVRPCVLARLLRSGTTSRSTDTFRPAPASMETIERPKGPTVDRFISRVDTPAAAADGQIPCQSNVRGGSAEVSRLHCGNNEHPHISVLYRHSTLNLDKPIMFWNAGEVAMNSVKSS